jgi:hypothetical protein
MCCHHIKSESRLSCGAHTQTRCVWRSEFQKLPPHWICDDPTQIDFVGFKYLTGFRVWTQVHMYTWRMNTSPGHSRHHLVLHTYHEVGVVIRMLRNTCWIKNVFTSFIWCCLMKFYDTPCKWESVTDNRRRLHDSIRYVPLDRTGYTFQGMKSTLICWFDYQNQTFQTCFLKHHWFVIIKVAKQSDYQRAW